MRFDASPPVCYVRLYRLCSLVPSPVFTHIFAFFSVFLCFSLFFSVFLCFSLFFSVFLCFSLFFSVFLCPLVLVSQSRHLSPSLSPAICPHLPVPPSVPISQSRHLSPSPCLFPAILLSAQPQHPIPSAHNPYIRSHWAVHSDEIGQLTTHLDEIGAEFVHFDHPITDFVRMNRTAVQRIRASDHQRDLFSGKASV